jgi:hypothetical protein
MIRTIITSCTLTICVIIAINTTACKKDKSTTQIDTDLYNMAKETNGFTWYKKQNIQLNKSAGSGHPQPFLKVRYNIAAAKLDSTGKIIAGTVFPNGSVIVKELYTSNTTLTRYAILYKQPNSEHADAKGWVWGYIDANGDVSISATEKGNGCISCHSQTDNIDYMLMNKYFP